MLKTLSNWYKGLINFLTKLPIAIKYPFCIIPKSKYKREIHLLELMPTHSIGFVRRSKKNHEETFDENGILREDAILPDEIHGFSMNMLGGKFKSTHIKFRVKKPASEHWTGEQIRFLKYYSCIEILNPAVPIFFLLADIQEEPFPYEIDIKSSKAKELTNKKAEEIIDKLGRKPLINNNKLILRGCLKIKHTPNKLNYWHAEIWIYDIEDKPIPKTKSEWTKSAAEYALNDVIAIKAVPFLKMSDYNAIEKKYYHKAI
jgi:hypothetical protein